MDMDMDGKCDRLRTLYFQITNHRKWWNFQIVSTVQDYELTTLLIRLVSAVVDLVTPGVDIYTLTIITSELILSTPGHLHRDVVWETIVTSYTEM